MKLRSKYIVPAVAAGLCAVAVLLAVYAVYGLFPFGDKNISWCDMDQQVVPLLTDFKDILAGKGNMLLSMSNAGGMNFWGVFFFFLASPFSFLVAFVKKADMLLFMNILVLLKMCLSAVCASVFFKKFFDKLSVASITALSLSYAFCGFTLLFYQNVIWLDMVWSFPLLLISLYYLLEKNKPLFFIAMLSLTMVMNYYIGYMVVVFILLAVPTWIFICVPKENRGRASLMFLVSCAVAALLTAVVWLPSLMQYMQSARGGGFLEGLSSGWIFDSYETKNLVLMCTPVVFAVLPFISLRGKENKNKLSCVLIMFLIMLFASVVEPVNRMWHTGNYQAFPLRYGYMIAFLGLALCAFVINEHEEGETTPKDVKVIAWCGGAAVVTYLCGKILTDHFFETITKYTSSLHGDDKSFVLMALWFAVGVLVSALLFTLVKMRKLSLDMFSICLCVTVAISCLFNGGVYIGSTANSDTNYRIEMDLENRIEDDSFYRVKSFDKYFVVNQVGAMNYNSLSHYTSLTDKDYMFAMKKMGYSSYWMEVNSNGGTVISDAILRNNYCITKLAADNVVYKNATYKIAKSNYTLPAGVVLNSLPEEYGCLPEMERSELQQHLFSLYTGSNEKVVQKYNHSEKLDVEYSYDNGLYYFELKKNEEGKDIEGVLYYDIYIEGSRALYFDAFKDISNNLTEKLNNSFSVRINGTLFQRNYPSQSSNGILHLGDFKDEMVEVVVSVKKNAVASSFGVFSIDTDTVKETFEKVGGCDMAVEGNTVTANVTAGGNQYLYLSLPYMEGYTASVNGKIVDLYKVNDSFVAIPLENGANAVKLSYLPSGFKAGALLSLLGVLMLALLAVLLKLKKLNAVNKVLGNVASYCLMAANIAVWIIIYIMPLIVYLVY